MILSIDKFGGEIPLRDARSLGSGLAQIAENCRTISGKVKLRGGVPDWVSMEETIESGSDGRKYSLSGGIVYEDGIRLSQEKPSKAEVKVVPFWDIETGYSGDMRYKFQLRHVFGIGGGGRSFLDLLDVRYDEKLKRHTLHFRYGGAILSGDQTAVFLNAVSADNCELLYGDHEIRFPASQSITIPDEENGVYATLFFHGIRFETFSPGSGATVINGADIYIDVSVVKNKVRRNYVLTYWDGRHESPPSDISDEVDVCDGDTVVITTPGYSGGHGDHEAEHSDLSPGYYLYRTGGSLSSSGYYFVDKVNPGEVYEDKKKDYLLQEKLSIVENPPTGLKFLREFNGALCAAKGNCVYFSEPYIENNWKSEYEYRFGGEVSGLSVMGNTLVVFCEGKPPSILQGSAPGYLSQTDVQDGFTCISTDSICASGDSTYYACPDGLVHVGRNGSMRLITNQFFTREQWAELDPGSMKCSCDQFEIRLYCGNGLIYIFDLHGEGLTLTRYSGGSYIWKSGIFTFPYPVCFRMIRCTTLDGGGQLTIYGGNNLGYKVSVPCSIPNGRAWRLVPNLFSREWCFEVSGSSDLIEIEAAESSLEIN